MLTHTSCSPAGPRGWLKGPGEVMYIQLGALEPGNEHFEDGVREILILVGKWMQLWSIVVSASMLKEVTVWRHLHQMETLK